MQFIRRDAHDVTEFGVHIANAEDVLAAVEEVMVELQPESHCCEARPWAFGERVQSKTVSVEEYDIEDIRGSNGRQGPGDEKVEVRHDVAGLALARLIGTLQKTWINDHVLEG